MAEDRPFPPTPRRLALARASGLTAASPRVVAAVAVFGVVAAIATLGQAMARRLGDWLGDACRASDGVTTAVGPARIASITLELALPIVGIASIAAVVAHLAQTRALWLPRRTIASGPRLPPHRGTWMAYELACLVTLGITTVAWLWLTAPQLAALLHAPRSAASALASFLSTLAIAWVTLSVGDALLRRRHLANALAMTRDEKREDDRLAAADPRWRAQRLSLHRDSTGTSVARAALVVVGDDVAVAIAWHPTRQPVPTRTATGRHTRAVQLTALARRHRVAVHRDVELARLLVDNEGPVPEAHWQRLAAIVAATQRTSGRDTSS